MRRRGGGNPGGHLVEPAPEEQLRHDRHHRWQFPRWRSHDVEGTRARPPGTSLTTPGHATGLPARECLIAWRSTARRGKSLQVMGAGFARARDMRVPTNIAATREDIIGARGTSGAASGVSFPHISRPRDVLALD